MGNSGSKYSAIVGYASKYSATVGCYSDSSPAGEEAINLVSARKGRSSGVWFGLCVLGELLVTLDKGASFNSPLNPQ